jgi:hypothetical protein
MIAGDEEDDSMSDYTITKVDNECRITPSSGFFPHKSRIAFENQTGDIATIYVWRLTVKVHEFTVAKNSTGELTLPASRWGQKQYQLTTRDTSPPAGAAMCSLYTVVLNTDGTAHPSWENNAGPVYHKGDRVWIRNSTIDDYEVTVYDNNNPCKEFFHWTTNSKLINKNGGTLTETIQIGSGGRIKKYKIKFERVPGAGCDGGHSGGNGDGPATGDGEIRVGSGPVTGGGDDE